MKNDQSSKEQKYNYRPWNGLEDEPYVCIPRSLWQSFLVQNLEKVKQNLSTEYISWADAELIGGDIAEQTALLTALICFCKFCENRYS